MSEKQPNRLGRVALTVAFGFIVGSLAVLGAVTYGLGMWSTAQHIPPWVQHVARTLGHDDAAWVSFALAAVGVLILAARKYSGPALRGLLGEHGSRGAGVLVLVVAIMLALDAGSKFHLLVPAPTGPRTPLEPPRQKPKKRPYVPSKGSPSNTSKLLASAHQSSVRLLGSSPVARRAPISVQAPETESRAPTMPSQPPPTRIKSKVATSSGTETRAEVSGPGTSGSGASAAGRAVGDGASATSESRSESHSAITGEGTIGAAAGSASGSGSASVTSATKG